MQARQFQAKHHLGGALFHKNPQTKGQVSKHTNIAAIESATFVILTVNLAVHVTTVARNKCPSDLFRKQKLPRKKKSKTDGAGRRGWGRSTPSSQTPHEFLFLIGVYF